jgi:hypothetical protein
MFSRVIASGVLLFAAAVQAQTMDPATRALIENLQARIDSLEQRLA